MASDRKVDLERGLRERNLELLRRVPKTDLHCHGMLSAPRRAFEELLGRPVPPPPASFGDFSDFSAYIVGHLFPAYTAPEGLRMIARAAFERAADDGVVYTEISFDLFLPDLMPGLTIEGMAEIMLEECARIRPRLLVAPEIGIDRTLPIDEIMPRLRRALASGVWKSIDLYADERYGAAKDFAGVFRLAGEHGLKKKAHAGELCGPESVREAVEVLGLDAVQHGVRAAECERVSAFLAERAVALHICPTSNCSLGVCPSMDVHPARVLSDRGVRLTVNTDDFALFGASASEELLSLARMGFSVPEIEQIVENGLAQIPPDESVIRPSP